MGPPAWTPAPGTASCGAPHGRCPTQDRSPCPAPPRAQPTAGALRLPEGESLSFQLGLTPDPPRCQIGGSGREHTSRASGDVRLGSWAGAGVGAAATVRDCKLLFRLTGRLLPQTLAWPLP